MSYVIVLAIVCVLSAAIAASLAIRLSHTVPPAGYMCQTLRVWASDSLGRHVPASGY